MEDRDLEDMKNRVHRLDSSVIYTDAWPAEIRGQHGYLVAKDQAGKWGILFGKPNLSLYTLSIHDVNLLSFSQVHRRGTRTS